MNGMVNWCRSFPAVRPSLSGRSLVESLLCEQRRNVIDVETVAHAGSCLRGLHHGNVAVAVIVVRCRAVQDAERIDFAAVLGDDLVSVLCFSAVSVVHG